MKYRPDIDGLRAIAVLSVLLFHLNTPGFIGGFVGVDVFFVISGFLITRLIKDAVETGAFSFTWFYLRRARRLLPALFVTLIGSYAAAFLLMAPDHFREFGLSVAAAAVSGSNFYFWTHSGYFDLGSKFQPLLHTWSLSVEEQFYLVFPAFFVAALSIKKRYFAPAAIFLCGLTSLLLAISLQDGSSFLLVRTPLLAESLRDGPTSIFYLPIFRIFEFTIGSMLVWFPDRGSSRSELLLALGLCLIGWTVATYDSQMLFPAANALPPCIGAALCLYAGRSPRLGLLLRNPISTFIGKISYSVYLVHWPLLIFYRYYAYRDTTPTENVVLFAASIALGYLSFKFIEQPFRKSGQPISFGSLASYASVAANIALIGYLIYAQNGWIWRLDPNAQIIASHRYEVGGAITTDFMGSLGCTDLCEFGDLTNPEIIIVAGDSHSDQYTKALAELSPASHFKLIQSGSCFIGSNLRSRPRGVMTPVCLNAESEMKRWLKDPRVSGVVHVQRWPGYKTILETNDGKPVKFKTLGDLYSAEIKDILDLYDGFYKPVVIVNSAPNTNLSCLSRPQYLSLYCPIPPLYEQRQFAEMIRTAIKDAKNITFVDPTDLLCSGDRCQLSDSDRRPLYSDEIHLTVSGAKLIVPEILDALSTSTQSLVLGDRSSRSQ